MESNNSKNPNDLLKTNSNEDILYKWRLRRKLEEATTTNNQNKINIDEFIGKKTPIISYQAHNLSEQVTFIQQQMQLLQSNTALDTARTTVSNPPIQTIDMSTTPIPPPIKTITETIGVQTSIEVPQSNYINEKPTRDNNRERIKQQNNNNKFSIKSRKSSHSPTYKSTSSTLIFDRTISSVQKSSISDLTKISSIGFEEPHIIANKNSIEKDLISMTNNNKPDENANNTEVVVYNQKVSSLIDTDNSRINNNLIFDSSYYESDEILNILFKKLFFYQSKLRQVYF